MIPSKPTNAVPDQSEQGPLSPYGPTVPAPVPPTSQHAPPAGYPAYPAPPGPGAAYGPPPTPAYGPPPTPAYGPPPTPAYGPPPTPAYGPPPTPAVGYGPPPSSALAAYGPPPAPPGPAANAGLWTFTFSPPGGDALANSLVNSLLYVVTCGWATALGYTRWRSEKFYTEGVTLNGAPMRYQASWGDSFSNFFLASLLTFCTCGFGRPWAEVMRREFHAKHTVTSDGRRTRFVGEAGTAWLLGVLTAVLVNPFMLWCLSTTWPILAVQWRSWTIKNTEIEDPLAPGGWRRLQFHAGPFSYIVKGFAASVATIVTLGFYAPFAVANFERWAWNATTEEGAPPKHVPSRPETPAEWAVVCAYGTIIAATVVGMVLLLLSLFGTATVASVWPKGPSGPAVTARSPGAGRAPAPPRDAPTARGVPTAPEVPVAPTAPVAPAAPGATTDASLPDVPSGRSKVPKLNEWSAGVSVNSAPQALRPPDCQVTVLREWLKAQCRGTDSSL
ncbi:MAG: hypothetical protein IT374_23600, partial [Polyangiaceae bacterium]|nr:hypothetical protein [Polyangiaceae bacterium]